MLIIFSLIIIRLPLPVWIFTVSVSYYKGTYYNNMKNLTLIQRHVYLVIADMGINVIMNSNIIIIVTALRIGSGWVFNNINKTVWIDIISLMNNNFSHFRTTIFLNKFFKSELLLNVFIFSFLNNIILLQY